MGWMAHRKWTKMKQQPSMLPGPAVPGSCFASFHFLWAIHPIRPVHIIAREWDGIFTKNIEARLTHLGTVSYKPTIQFCTL